MGSNPTPSATTARTSSLPSPASLISPPSRISPPSPASLLSATTRTASDATR
ncbi:hypothetical protein [Frigoribacterium sp. VKM Ac-2530]|uniref:hypothetical protein n=1 Tax=Frigoribacterium sp. VKM Ac-2530 TaxID=2783822 RepID=UPI00188C53F4|nr:hypothetical protein [Frigoribacterium sp. VKM Ac-2530]MBF4579483.1 hypothetical protein [Frigoribacterium sp. VKM Ac-2530]